METAQRYLFGELGFRGYQSEIEYFDPRNSCLNHVLERRTGLPITLSVLYMEVARRLRMPVFGIGLPRHFVIQFDDGNYSTFIDPFHEGRPITARDCFKLADARVADPSLLRRVNAKQIVMRMLQNMHIVYRHQKDHQRSLDTLDLMICGAPETASWYKHRGDLLVELNRRSEARREWERYLALEPGAADREQVMERMRVVQNRIARLN